MKIAIFFVTLLALAFAQDGCKVFTCGDITSPEGSTQCIQLEKSNAIVTYRSAVCPKDEEVCQAWKWMSVADIEDSADCGTDKWTPTWPTQYDPQDNAALDGDHCDKVESCYTSEKNTATCKSNVCKASTKVDDSCADSKDCPIGHYCAQDPLVCTKLTADGEKCASTAECGWRRSCLTVGDDTDAKCVAQGTLENGKQFKRVAGEASSESNADLTGSIDCKSGWEIVIGDITQCRSGQRNKNQARDSLKQDTVGAKCQTSIYTNEDPAKSDEGTDVETTSVCGFNQDNKSWCPLLSGDDLVIEAKSSFQTTLNGVKCHKNTGGPGSVCQALVDTQIKKAGWTYYQLSTQASTPEQFANTANNVDCVAKTVTANFWQGQFTSAYKVSAVASLFVLVASLIY